MCHVTEQSEDGLLREGDALAKVDFRGYCRRLDGFEYRAKRLDVPRDSARLLELAQVIELEERIILDRTDNGE